MIRDILASRERLENLKAELVRMEEGTRGVKTLTEEEKKDWQLIRKRIYQMFPPAEVLPRYLTFNGSTNLFYGEGVSLHERVPRLFLELARAMLRAGGTRLNLVNAGQQGAGLTIPAAEPGIRSLELEESTVMITFSSNFRQLAEFLGQLNKLRRMILVSRIAVKPESGVLRNTITIKTYHCRPGVLDDVPA
jgi:hypothetical protein